MIACRLANTIGKMGGSCHVLGEGYQHTPGYRRSCALPGRLVIRPRPDSSSPSGRYCPAGPSRRYPDQYPCPLTGSLAVPESALVGPSLRFVLCSHNSVGQNNLQDSSHRRQPSLRPLRAPNLCAPLDGQRVLQAASSRAGSRMPRVLTALDMRDLLYSR